MKDPTGDILFGVYEKSAVLLAGIGECYELTPPAEGASMPYDVIEATSVIRHGSKTTEGTDVIVQHRICTETIDHTSPGLLGDALMQGLLPNVITLTNFDITEAVLELIIPASVIRDGDDLWTESLYRIRYTLHEN